MSFGHQVLGFGTVASAPREVGVITQLGLTGDLIDPQAGDVVFLTTGSLLDSVQAQTLMVDAGYTNISRIQATTNWYPAGSAHYFVQGNIQYRILDGTETKGGGPSGINSGAGYFMQYRFPKPITSVTATGLTTRVSGSALSGTYPSTTRPAGGGVIRWVAGGAYGGNGLPALGTGSPQYVGVEGAYATMKITETTTSGSYGIQAAGMYGASFFVTMVCTP